MEATTGAAKIQPWRKLVTRGLCGSLKLKENPAEPNFQAIQKDADCGSRRKC